MSVIHPGDITQSDGDTATVAQLQVAYLLQVTKFIHRPDDILGVPLFQGTACHVDIFGCQPPHHIIDIQGANCQLLFADLDTDFIFPAAPDLDRGHTGNLLEPTFDHLFPYPPQLVKRDIPGNTESQDGIEIGIITQEQRAFDIVVKVDLVQLLPYLLERTAHIGIPGKFQNYIG